MDTLGAQGLAISEYRMGDSMFLFKNSNYGEILSKLFGHLYNKIELNSVVTSIQVEKGEVQVKINDKTRSFKRVVCTVPKAVLKKIEWQPPLSKSRLDIISNHIGMAQGGKFFILLSKVICPSDVETIYFKTLESCAYWVDIVTP